MRDVHLVGRTGTDAHQGTGPARHGRTRARIAVDPIDAGRSSPVARHAHNLKVVGSNPTPATSFRELLRTYTQHDRNGCKRLKRLQIRRKGGEEHCRRGMRGPPPVVPAGDGTDAKIASEGAPRPLRPGVCVCDVPRNKSGGLRHALLVSRAGTALFGQPGAWVRLVSGMGPRGGHPPPACPPADLHRRPGAAGCPPSRSGI
jgi:hypothetical protein